MSDLPRLGLLLLTGGQGARLGGPKHDRAHPSGGTWGGHLVNVFRAVSGGPIAVVGEALPDHPELRPLEDPREGPAVALRHWAIASPVPARRWWVVGCDQVHWTAEDLQGWLDEAEAADPEGARWVLGFSEGRLQPLGGFLGGNVIPDLAVSKARSLMALAETLPGIDLPGPEEAGRDVDTPEDLDAWGV